MSSTLALQDIAIVTGAEYIAKDLGMKVRLLSHPLSCHAVTSVWWFVMLDCDAAGLVLC